MLLRRTLNSLAASPAHQAEGLSVGAAYRAGKVLKLNNSVDRVKLFPWMHNDTWSRYSLAAIC
jgi:hypothetical protein